MEKQQVAPLGLETSAEERGQVSPAPTAPALVTRVLDFFDTFFFYILCVYTHMCTLLFALLLHVCGGQREDHVWESVLSFRHVESWARNSVLVSGGYINKEAILLVLSLCLEIHSHCVARASLYLMVFLPQPSEG